MSQLLWNSKQCNQGIVAAISSHLQGILALSQSQWISITPGLLSLVFSARRATMSGILPYLLLIVGFILLIKGADFLVSGASSIARRMHVSDLVIGLTIVAFGTSTPELFVNIFASIKGNTDIAIGNVLGSNIANIFLILGVSSVIYPLTVTKGVLLY